MCGKFDTPTTAQSHGDDTRIPRRPAVRQRMFRTDELRCQVSTSTRFCVHRPLNPHATTGKEHAVNSSAGPRRLAGRSFETDSGENIHQNPSIFESASLYLLTLLKSHLSSTSNTEDSKPPIHKQYAGQTRQQRELNATAIFSGRVGVQYARQPHEFAKRLVVYPSFYRCSTRTTLCCDVAPAAGVVPKQVVLASP